MQEVMAILKFVGLLSIGAGVERAFPHKVRFTVYRNLILVTGIGCQTIQCGFEYLPEALAACFLLQ